MRVTVVLLLGILAFSTTLPIARGNQSVAACDPTNFVCGETTSTGGQCPSTGSGQDGIALWGTAPATAAAATVGDSCSLGGSWWFAGEGACLGASCVDSSAMWGGWASGTCWTQLSMEHEGAQGSGWLSEFDPTPACPPIAAPFALLP
ncbi:MAG: hypothetical protein ACYDDF_03050 [Thermoplasmatota archaeon]